MKFKVVALLMLVSLMITLCAGCTSDVSMPYSSQDYMNGEWTIQELEKHFKELGFTEIEVTGNTTKIIASTTIIAMIGVLGFLRLLLVVIYISPKR